MVRGMTAPAEPPFDRSSRRRLSPQTARFFRGDTLFDRVARTLCEADCLPRKELYEAWEVAKRVRRHLRGGMVVEACAGHGLLAYLMLLLEPKASRHADSDARAVCIDMRKPASAAKIGRAMEARWPALAGRVAYVERKVGEAALAEVGEDAMLVSVHACGSLTDLVLELAMQRRLRVAVMPCCHELGRSDLGDLDGWLPGPMAVDVVRATRLREAGYRVRTKTIPADITVQNRLLIGEPV